MITCTKMGIGFRVDGNSLKQTVHLSNNPGESFAMYDLSQIVGITCVTTIEDEKARIDKGYSKNVVQNIVIGAVAGGIIDFSIGQDGLLDGIALGALSGWFFSSSKEKPVASIVVSFADHTKLPLTVDADGMGLIIAAIDKSKPVTIKPAKSSYQLSESQIAEHHRRSLRFKDLVYSVFFGSAIGIVWFVYAILSFESSSGASRLFATIHHDLFSLGQSLVLGLVSGLVFFVLRKHFINQRQSQSR